MAQPLTNWYALFGSAHIFVTSMEEALGLDQRGWVIVSPWFTTLIKWHVTFNYKTFQIIVFDHNIFCTRFHFWSNKKCGHPLDLLVNFDWDFKKIAWDFWGVFLNIKYNSNFFHQNQKSNTLLIAWYNAIYSTYIALMVISIFKG